MEIEARRNLKPKPFEREKHEKGPKKTKYRHVVIFKEILV
jgi:hypothetical protein